MRRSLIVFAVTALVSAATVEAQSSGSVFPLARHLAGDADLPLPWGIGFYFFHQSQSYDLVSLGLTPAVLEAANLGEVDIDNRLTELNLKADLWVLPFLNVHLLLGEVDGHTTVSLDPPPPFGGLLDRIVVEYDGLVYGGGFTLAAGNERYFGSLTTSYTQVEPNQDLSSIEAWIVTPKAGMRFGEGVFWIGAMGQQTTEQHVGSIVVPFLGELGYEVELEEQNAWNALIGVEAELGERWTLQLEAGFGPRDHVMSAVTWRF